MSSYNFFERSLSRLLKSFPTIHLRAKKGYQNINYILSRLVSSDFQQYELYSYLSFDDFIVNEVDESQVFFGYYDHSPWSADMKFLILNVVIKDVLTLKLYERINGKYLFKKDIVQTSAFNLQQGIRAAWINNDEIIFNCIHKKQLVCSIYNIKNDTKNYFAYPAQEIKDNTIFCIDYSHLDEINKDYGYNLLNKGYSMKDIDGILGYDIADKSVKFNLERKKIDKLSMIKDDIGNCEINHINASPFNNSIMFIYRNKGKNSTSELYHFSFKENNLRRVFSGTIVSHYCWVSPTQILVYLGRKVKDQGYYLIEILDSNSNEINQQHKMGVNGDGHPSLCPNSRFVVYDSYPDRNRYIHLNLYDTQNKKVIEIGRFFSPLKYSGYYRCDLHPRWSPDGNYISIDSSHSGLRRHYIIDVSNIIKKSNMD